MPCLVILEFTLREGITAVKRCWELLPSLQYVPECQPAAGGLQRMACQLQQPGALVAAIRQVGQNRQPSLPGCMADLPYETSNRHGMSPKENKF